MNNLISNAIKYSNLKKERLFVMVKAEKEINQTLIHVIDNGIGINEELHDKIFNIFLGPLRGPLDPDLDYILSMNL